MIKSIVMGCMILVSFSLNAQIYKLNAPKGYTNYKWYKTDLISGTSIVIAGATQDTISVSTSGMYYCEFDAKACRKKSDIVVIVSRCQTTSDTAVNLNAATTSPGTYQWYKDGTALVGEVAAKKLVTFRDESEYYAQVFTGSCTLKTEKFIVRALNGGLANISSILLNCK